jgi:uncharacterized protein YfaS (alpha-2-macroglobulin family)
MNRLLIFLLCAVALAPGLRAADDDDSSSAPDTTGTGSGFSPSGGTISPGDIFTISFPVPMVAPEAIDKGGEPWPVMATPKVDGTFLWKSQTEGQLVISKVVAGAKHHFALVPGVKDLSGKPPADDKIYNADFTAPAFSFSTDVEFRKGLTAEPHIPLTATYKVRLTDVPEHVWIQDRDSRAHYPIEVIQGDDDPSLEAYEFQVAPREPLPPNHTYDLVIDGLREAMSNQALPYPAVFALGDTHDLRIEWVGAFNPALDVPIIRIKFNDSIPPDALKPGMVSISPEVQGLKMVAQTDEIDLTGTFDLNQRYGVTITQGLESERGYKLAAEAHWFAKFPPRQPCISFPGPTVYLRSTSQVHFSFIQSHTPQVTWRLASIPLEKLPAVTDRLTEFTDAANDPLTGQTIPDPKTGENKQVQTELLVDALKLPVLLTGTCPGIDTNTDATRSITAPLPDGTALSGPCLIEASATLPDGRIAGGRALLFFSNYILTETRSPTQAFLRVAKMSDAMPVAGITVRAVRDDNIEITRALTDANGMAAFPLDKLFPPAATTGNAPQTHLFIAYTPGGLSLAMADGSTYATVGDAAPARVSNHALLITDRNLYRPGEEVKIKGILRDESPDGLAIPKAGTVDWQITQGDGSKTLGEGTATLSALGSFSASWPIPKEAALGPCTLQCTLDGTSYSGNTQFSIEEYRVPLFTVDMSAATEVGKTAHAMVSSAFFHGGANVGALVHWTAAWQASTESGTNSVCYNSHAQIGPVLDDRNAPSRTIQGDGRLDQNGQLRISCDSPFQDNPAVGPSGIAWTADVTSMDGQTITGGTSESFSSTPVILSVHAEEKMTAPRGISVRVDELDPDLKPIKNPLAVTVDLYHVTTRTVREQVAPLVFRYKNTDEYAKVDSHEATAPGSLTFSATETGNYVVAVHSNAIRTPLVSDDVEVTGEEPAQLPVENETSFSLTPTENSWKPGEKAVFDVEAPFAGVAWVCVETDQLLDTMLVPLSGNAARIEIPVKKEYAPNATVSVYLTRPGGASELPVERFATASLLVERPDRELQITPHLESVEVRPGQNVHGEFTVTNEGKPVAGADLAVFAVDDAVLDLGEWAIPDAFGTFYPLNPYQFTNYQSLGGYSEPSALDGNFQKGFIIGGGSAYDTGAPGGNALRKEFRTLAYWNASLETDGNGKASFGFKAPDNLTTYRIVAIGQTAANQFGGNSDATVKINKPLLIDPALPRFVRDGDELELRAVVRQNFADSAPVMARCVTGSGCTLTAATSLNGTVERGAPFVLRFRAKINDPDLKPIKVTFSAVAQADARKTDSVEVTIPVSAPTIVRHESVSGDFTGPRFDAPAVMPEDWKKGRGQYALTLSTSSWLPAIAGIPTILDYPHGCFEQITSKLLCYALLANLTDYLPGTQVRLADYKPIFQKGIAQINSSLLTDGRLPYWPGDTEGNDFVTCQAAWALNEAATAGFELPEGLTAKLSKAVKQIASGGGDIDNRAFALYVLATMQRADADDPAIAEDVYLHRQEMGFDGRALFAMALHRWNIMKDEKLQVMREIDHAIVPTAFDPENFGSPDRTEGICAMAFETIAPPNFTTAKKDEIRKRLLHVLDTGSVLSATPDNQMGFNITINGNRFTITTFTFSTQENLWLILAFKSMIDSQPAPPLAAAQPAAALVSKNRASAEWPGKANSQLSTPFAVNALNNSALTFLMQANYSLPQLDAPRVDRGFRLERIVHDLTDPKRKGDAASPYHIGDQLLVTYREFSANQQYFVALEDALPAAFETVNPDLAQVGKFFNLPEPDPNDQLLGLSHSEMRDQSTLLYFDSVPYGPGVYSILVRVTAAGTFRWPQTQINPMYDSRFSGCSASSVCVVTAD